MVRLSPEIADAQLAALRSQFERTGAPVQVSFREILPTPFIRERTTHDLHPYPARLLVNIPAFFLSTSLSRRSDVVLDPFCGSGTALLEAILAGRNAAGADANPLARLLTRAKLTPISSRSLQSARRRFFRRLTGVPRRNYPKVVNLEYWFYPHVREGLLRLLENIDRMRDAALKDFFYVAFSACIKEVSLADPRLSVPVRLKENQYPIKHWLHDRTNKRLEHLNSIDVLSVFAKRLDDNIRRAAQLTSQTDLGHHLGLAFDARNLGHLQPESVDFAITSPPYLGAQKYIRASSLSLTWLELCDARGLRALEDNNIGREHHLKLSYAKLLHTDLPEADALLNNIREINPLRAHIAAAYLCEMRQAIREIARVLKPNRYFVLVAGASRVCGMLFPTPQFLTCIAAAEGLVLRLHLVDPIRSRALMTKRHHTAGRIDTESILLLRKED